MFYQAKDFLLLGCELNLPEGVNALLIIISTMAARSAGRPAASYAIAFAYDGTARHRGSWDLIKKKSGSSSNPRSHSGSQVILPACCSAALPQFRRQSEIADLP